MKVMRIRHWAAAVLLVVIVTAVAGVLASRATARAEVREIALVARGMAFYAGGSGANPTITLRPGERVRFIVRNETPGMLHDIAIDALGVAMNPVAAGETGTLELQVPGTPGRHEYYCRPHAVMMKGVVEIR